MLQSKKQKTTDGKQEPVLTYGHGLESGPLSLTLCLPVVETTKPADAEI